VQAELASTGSRQAIAFAAWHSNQRCIFFAEQTTGILSMGLIKSTFTWWNSLTWGTWLFTWRKGERVGEDAQGNVYYKERAGTRRWVIYNGDVEASRVPPEWHAWLHYTVAEPPTLKPPVVKPWEKPHQPNETGTTAAYLPEGSLAKGGQRARATGDYEAWRP
jgi:NADH:ubiquinone oxidoreductase subunit